MAKLDQQDETGFVIVPADSKLKHHEVAVSARDNPSVDEEHEWLYIYSCVVCLATIDDPSHYIPPTVDGSNYRQILARVNKSVGISSRYAGLPGAIRYNLNELLARVGTPLLPPPDLDPVREDATGLAWAQNGLKEGRITTMITELSATSGGLGISVPRPRVYTDIFLARWSKELSEHPTPETPPSFTRRLQAPGQHPPIQPATRYPLPSTQPRPRGPPPQAAIPSQAATRYHPSFTQALGAPYQSRAESDDEILTDED